ncbi:MAG: hypothetical protein WED04_09255 [Promethearchaeati archaeon SRVP18_Atabeyarchaeia-1]
MASSQVLPSFVPPPVSCTGSGLSRRLYLRLSTNGSAGRHGKHSTISETEYVKTPLSQKQGTSKRAVLIAILGVSAIAYAIPMALKALAQTVLEELRRHEGLFAVDKKRR